MGNFSENSKIIRSEPKKAFKANLIFHYYTLVYGLVTGVFLLPYIISHVGLEKYGQWTVISYVTMLLGLLDPGIGTLITNRVIGCKGNKYRAGLEIYFGMGYSACVLLISTIIFSIVLLMDIYFNIFPSPVWLYALGTIVFLYSSNGLVGFLQGIFQSYWLGIITVASTLGSVLTLVVLLETQYGVLAIAISLLIKQIIFFFGNVILLIFIQKRIIKIKYIWILRREIFLYFVRLYKESFAIGASKGFYHLASMLDIFILAKVLGSREFGEYSIIRKLVDVGRSFLDKPIIAAMPLIAHRSINDSSPRMQFDKSQILVFSFFIFVTLIVAYTAGGYVFKFIAGVEISSMSNVIFLYAAVYGISLSIVFSLANYYIGTYRYKKAISILTTFSFIYCFSYILVFIFQKQMTFWISGLIAMMFVVLRVRLFKSI